MSIPGVTTNDEPRVDVIEIGSGEWGILSHVPSGTYVVKRGFRTNAEAWGWVDKNNQEGLDAIDRHNRIRDVFNGCYWRE